MFRNVGGGRAESSVRPRPQEAQDAEAASPRRRVRRDGKCSWRVKNRLYRRSRRLEHELGQLGKRYSTLSQGWNRKMGLRFGDQVTGVSRRRRSARSRHTIKKSTAGDVDGADPKARQG